MSCCRYFGVFDALRICVILCRMSGCDDSFTTPALEEDMFS